jgi:hypothetical protein
MALWAVAEVVCGFIILCSPATPVIFSRSQCVHRVVSLFRGLRLSMSNTPTNLEDQVVAPACRPKRRQPDASLFTDTDMQSDMLVLTEIRVTSECTVQSGTVTLTDIEEAGSSSADNDEASNRV